MRLLCEQLSPEVPFTVFLTWDAYAMCTIEQVLSGEVGSEGQPSVMGKPGV